MEVIADKVTFLSTTKPGDKEEDNIISEELDEVCDECSQEVIEGKNKKKNK